MWSVVCSGATSLVTGKNWLGDLDCYCCKSQEDRRGEGREGEGKGWKGRETKG